MVPATGSRSGSGCGTSRSGGIIAEAVMEMQTKHTKVQHRKNGHHRYHQTTLGTQAGSQGSPDQSRASQGVGKSLLGPGGGGPVMGTERCFVVCAGYVRRYVRAAHIFAKRHAHTRKMWCAPPTKTSRTYPHSDAHIPSKQNEQMEGWSRLRMGNTVAFFEVCVRVWWCVLAQFH